MLCLEEFSGGLFGPSGFLFASGGFLRGMAYSVRGAIACTRLSLEAERLSLGPPDLQLPAQLQWVDNPEGCCSGQLFAAVVREGAATPEGVFAALTSRA
eukprot:scaffold12417_cov131-Isochrysis_galbana.AAC.14